MKKYASKLYYEKGARQVWALVQIIFKATVNWRFEAEQKFIIFGQGRTGSTLLVNLINGAESVFCDGEIFGTEYPFDIWHKRLYMKLRSKAFKQKIYGCRIKIYELYMHQGMSTDESIAFINTLAKDGWRIIHLTRTNKFRQCLSSLVAEERNVYHFTDKSVTNKKKVTVKAEEIPDRLKLLHSFDQQEHDALKDISFLSVNYEKDLENKNHHQATLDRICTFLDIPKAKSVVNLKRTSSSKIEDYIENHDEVKSVLASKNLEYYLSQ
ncbi:hypothetical protein OAB13_00915 [Salibacteraceae bacterium]|jgi:LPS sulfotransferase NodH|nr:hypothetical protein [Salibacteraceae bacterium]